MRWLIGLLIQMLSDLHLLMLKPIDLRLLMLKLIVLQILMHLRLHWPNGLNLRSLRLNDLR